MSLPRITHVRLIAIVLCLLAFGVYLSFSPSRSLASANYAQTNTLPR